LKYRVVFILESLGIFYLLKLGGYDSKKCRRMETGKIREDMRRSIYR
jgi:hypothetical protein